MKRLGDLTLPDALYWSDRYASPPVQQEVMFTMAGRTVVFSQERCQEITLVAGEGSVWLDQTQVDGLMAMAHQTGATFPLIWENETHTVMFRHHEPPAVALTPLWPGGNRYGGTIRLLAV